MNRDEINKLFQDGMSGKLEQNHELLIHLGGGVYVTVSTFYKCQSELLEIGDRRTDEMV
jgi:prefoldin subunit 5